MFIAREDSSRGEVGQQFLSGRNGGLVVWAESEGLTVSGDLSDHLAESAIGFVDGMSEKNGESALPGACGGFEDGNGAEGPVAVFEAIEGGHEGEGLCGAEADVKESTGRRSVGRPPRPVMREIESEIGFDAIEAVLELSDTSEEFFVFGGEFVFAILGRLQLSERVVELLTKLFRPGILSECDGSGQPDKNHEDPRDESTKRVEKSLWNHAGCHLLRLCVTIGL